MLPTLVDSAESYDQSQPVSTHLPAPGRPLRWCLLATVLASLVPLLAFTGLIIWFNTTLQYDALHRSILDTVRALRLLSDEEWETTQETLNTLADSVYLDTGDWRAFYDFCAREAARYPGAWIVLFAPSGQQVINTLHPFGAALPNAFTLDKSQPQEGAGAVSLANPETVRRAFETGEHVYSDLFIGFVQQRPAVSVAAPVLRDGRVIYVLTMAMFPDIFTRLLQKHGVSGDMISSILDRRGITIARSREPEQFIGRPGPSELLAGVAKSDEGWVEGRSTTDQIPVYRVWSRSPVTGWTAVIKVTQASITGPVTRSLVLWTGGAIGFLGLGLGLALYMARRVTTPLAALARSADLVQRGQPVTIPTAAVQEVRELYAALMVAADAVRQHAIERERRLTAEAHQAKAEAERRRLEGEAQRIQHFALLGRLAAGVSHEIRNPLAAIFLHVDCLEEEFHQPSPESQEAITEALTEIKANLARLDDLLQDYLSLVRVSTIKREVQDLGAAMQDWYGEFKQLAVTQGMQVQCDGLADLGQVSFHASTLRRALLNLVQNALESMPSGGTVTITGQSTVDQVQLQVHDTGSGIPAERLAQIFEPLHTTKPGGTGLGLYIVQEVLAAHGGKVTVASVTEQGTTFTLTLPRQATPPSAAPFLQEL